MLGQQWQWQHQQNSTSRVMHHTSAFRNTPEFVFPLHRERAALHLELQTPKKTQKSSTNEEISTAWATTRSCLKEKAVQEKKASWQAELAHRWNLMSCTIINNILLQLQGVQINHKGGWTGMSLLWFIPDSVYDQRFCIWSCWIKTFCIFKIPIPIIVDDILLKQDTSYNQQRVHHIW